MTRSGSRWLLLNLTLALASGPVLAARQSAIVAPQQPLVLDDANIKFSLRSLMGLLRDRDHEGWVLAAYPDPATSRPLIGAGFGLDVVATDHEQSDPLNVHQFVEPSTLQLWQVAGLEPERLHRVLDDYHRNMDLWGEKLYRKKIRAHTLPQQLTEDEATRLLGITARQAVHNAKAYCRYFDRLNASQQLALSQLVFQMGVNLEQFVQFLSELNGDTHHRDLSLPEGGIVTDADHWKCVQAALIDSKWARLYTTRAVTVIAMFDPNYARSPTAAERRVLKILRPTPPPRHKQTSARKRSKPAHRTGR